MKLRLSWNEKPDENSRFNAWILVARPGSTGLGFHYWLIPDWGWKRRIDIQAWFIFFEINLWWRFRKL